MEIKNIKKQNRNDTTMQMFQKQDSYLQIINYDEVKGKIVFCLEFFSVINSSRPHMKDTAF